MRFVIQRTPLLHALSLLAHAAARGKTEMPLLAHIRCEVDAAQRQVKLQTTNLEISLTVCVSLDEWDAAGTVALPAALLLGLLPTIEQERLTFQIDPDIWKVKLTYPGGQATFTGMSVEEFPPFPVVEQEAFQLFPASLRKAIRWMGVSVIREDDGRPALTCLLLQGAFERLHLASADGRRVSFGEVVLPAGVDATPLGNVLVPFHALRELASILTDDVLVMSLNANRSQILFQTPRFVLSAILMNGEFPNYRSVVPPERPVRVVAKTEDLNRLVRGARLFAGEQKALQVTMHPGAGLEPGTVTVLARSETGSTMASIPAVIRGPHTEITFNSTLIMDALQSITDQETVLEIGQAINAKTPAPAGLMMGATDETLVHALMPMKV